MSEFKKAPIDWDEVRERLERAGEYLAGSLSPSGGRDVLRKRAEALSVPVAEAQEDEAIQAVVFKLGGERFAFETAFLKEVSPVGEIVPVPCTPSFVLGMVSFRAEVLSVMDLRKFFDLPDRGISDMNRLLVLSSGDMQFGVLADAVEGVRPIKTAELKKLPTLSGVREEYLYGVSPEGITVLDGGKLLADRSIIVHEKAD